MTIAPGTKLGRYEIRSKIGEGGMGEVYLAHDTKLERSVALKILPSDVASNEERMRRFTQEAKAAAALNHPNIAHIYEIGETEGTHFIAMEYIDGVTLNEKIHREKTALRKLLKYLTQVAEGLAKAHAAGIVHRDLKPDNIMIAREDYAKILDFGLAKLIRSEPPAVAGGFNADELNEAATAMLAQHSTAGMIMGTVGYMSPEQAQGKVREIDHRSDIFSFGCILYEAATGQKAFAGKDLLDSLHKIVHAPTPQIKDFNASTPDELQRIVRRCLAKEPEKRYQSIKEVAIELEELQQELKSVAELKYSAQPASSGTASSIGTAQTESAHPSASGTVAIGTARSTSSAEYLITEIKRHKHGVLLALTALVVVVAGVTFGLYKLISRNRARPPLSFQIGKLTPITTNGKAVGAAISPDGKYVAYAMDEDGKQSLWLRQVAIASNAPIVPVAEAQYSSLTFSRDGNFLYYTIGERTNPALSGLYQITLLGRNQKRLIAGPITGITLSPDGNRLAFVRRGAGPESSLIVANADGSGEQVLATRKAPEIFIGPLAWSPDGKIIACVTLKRGANLLAVSVDGGVEKPMSSHRWNGVSSVAWLADGSGVIVTALDRSLGPNAQIWQISYPGSEERRITNDLNDYQRVSMTADSSALITMQENISLSLWIVPQGETNRAAQITSRTGKDDGQSGVAWTPDGRIVYTSTASGSGDLWMMNADGSNQKQLTMNAGRNVQPAVSPDGRYLVCMSDRAGNLVSREIWRMNLDGSDPRQLVPNGGYPQFSSDGNWVISEHGRSGLRRTPVEGGTPVQLTDQPSFYLAVSPDGKLVACFYGSLSGKITVIPFEGGPSIKTFDPPPTVASSSRPGGLRWTPDGRALTYVITLGGVSNIWSQPLDGGPPKQLTDFKAEQIFAFDWSRDGRLLLSRGVANRDVVLISGFK